MCFPQHPEEEFGPPCSPSPHRWGVSMPTVCILEPGPSTAAQTCSQTPRPLAARHSVNSPVAKRSYWTLSLWAELHWWCHSQTLKKFLLITKIKCKKWISVWVSHCPDWAVSKLWQWWRHSAECCSGSGLLPLNWSKSAAGVMSRPLLSLNLPLKQTYELLRDPQHDLLFRKSVLKRPYWTD